MALLKSLKRNRRMAGRLSPLEWPALMEAWLLLPAFCLAARWISYERLSGLVHPARRALIDTADRVDTAERLGRVVALSSRLHFLPMTCLAKALALRWILSRHGIPSRLCIGANKSFDRIHAHAWVEVQGRAIGEPQDIDRKFHVLASDQSAMR